MLSGSRWLGSNNRDNVQSHAGPELQFVEAVRRNFAFLGDAGFAEIEALPTLVRYRSGKTGVDVHHGRKSFEVGLQVSFHNKRYSLSEMIRVFDPVLGNQFRNMVARDDASLETALAHLRDAFLRHGAQSLENEKAYFKRLDELKMGWVKAYVLDALVQRTRPKAAAAFRRADYRTAAELYGKIEGRLSPAEAMKLQIARQRSGTG